MPMFRRTLAGIALALAGVFAIGCSSTDQHVFVSPPSRPATVSVVDVQQQETLWSLPIPAGEKLLLNLQRNGTSTPATSKAVPADYLTWELYPGPAGGIVKQSPLDEPIDQGHHHLPGTPVLLKVSYAQPKPPTRSAAEGQTGEHPGGAGKGGPPGPAPAAQGTPPGPNGGHGASQGGALQGGASQGGASQGNQPPNGPSSGSQGQPQGPTPQGQQQSGQGRAPGQPSAPASATPGQTPPRASDQSGGPSAPPASQSAPTQDAGNAPTSPPPPSPGANAQPSPAGQKTPNQEQGNQSDKQSDQSDQNDQDMMFK